MDASGGCIFVGFLEERDAGRKLCGASSRFGFPVNRNSSRSTSSITEIPFKGNKYWRNGSTRIVRVAFIRNCFSEVPNYHSRKGKKWVIGARIMLSLFLSPDVTRNRKRSVLHNRDRINSPLKATYLDICLPVSCNSRHSSTLVNSISLLRDDQSRATNAFFHAQHGYLQASVFAGSGALPCTTRLN